MSEPKRVAGVVPGESAVTAMGRREFEGGEPMKDELNLGRVLIVLNIAGWSAFLLVVWLWWTP